MEERDEVTIDFAGSFMTWKPQNPDGNIARIQLDAACTLTDPVSGATETFYLIAPCRSERMYGDDRLFAIPNYEYSGIWSERAVLILRTHWVSDRDYREYGEFGERPQRYRGVHLDVRAHRGVVELTEPAEIIAATLDNRPLIGRTELLDEASGLRAVLEYPIKTMNVARHPDRFQVDTGPLIVPSFAAEQTRPIERFDVAHVVYNRLDKAEFILRRPTPIGADGGPPSTTDYSQVWVTPARHSLQCAMG
jgi:hypothetical protein